MLYELGCDRPFAYLNKFVDMEMKHHDSWHPKRMLRLATQLCKYPEMTQRSYPDETTKTDASRGMRSWRISKEKLECPLLKVNSKKNPVFILFR